MNLRNSIAVIDLGGQYAHLIASKLRSSGFSAFIADPEDNVSELSEAAGIILSGSPSLSAYDEDSSSIQKILDLKVPILGFCFGHQEIAKHYGGTVIRGKEEFGPAVLKIVEKNPIFKGIPETSIVWMSHGDTVSSVPEGFKELGVSYAPGEESSDIHGFAAIGNDELKRYGFQYHPEVDNSEYGEKMLANFASEICGLEDNWKSENITEKKIKEIKEKVKNKDVVLLVSGGVDSTVLGSLLLKALTPEQVHMIHVDTGFMRKDESKEVVGFFTENGSKNFHFIEAENLFFKELEGVTEPEKKRNIIGELFVKICETEMKKLDLSNALLAQGTIYPDTVESGGPKRARVIKTHHNRVKLMEKMIEEGLVIEPLADLYKNEVREMGKNLGIPEKMLSRHPFPGPGLAVRLLASEGNYPENYEQVSNNIVNTDNYDYSILPIPSVGVKADLRSYELPLVLEGENFDYEKLSALVPKIVKTNKGINRVLWNFGVKITETEPLKAGMTKKRTDLLRECDAIVNENLKKYGLLKQVWQFPTVMFPMKINGKAGEIVVLRPVKSVRAMTATVPELPREFYDETVRQISEFPQIQTVLLDLTTKPPGTIEWE